MERRRPARLVARCATAMSLCLAGGPAPAMMQGKVHPDILGPCGSINVKGLLVGSIYSPIPNPASRTSIDSTQTFDCTNGSIPACTICIACFLYAEYPVFDSDGGFMGYRKSYLDMSVRTSQGGACGSVGNSTNTTFSALPTTPGQRYRWSFGTNSIPGGCQDSDTMEGDSPNYDLFDSLVFRG